MGNLLSLSPSGERVPSGVKTGEGQCGALSAVHRPSPFRRFAAPSLSPIFDEVIVSQFMVSPALQTLPIAMYASVTRSTDPTIAAAATLILTRIRE